MKALGQLIIGVSAVTFAVTGIWGFILCLGIISKAAGFLGLLAALILTPITLFVAPLYAGFAWGDWFPLTLNYGGGLAAAALVGIGMKLNAE